MSTWQVIHADCRNALRALPERSVHCVVTSPPYFGLRDYNTPGQIGLEPTPDEYVTALVDVFREVRRVLRDDGTVWLNLGDSYAANRSYQVSDSKHLAHEFGASNATVCPPGCKPKDLLGIPWLVAFALRADGWFLRSDIIWSKPNPMPESVTDRPTKAHEYLFLLSKGPRYFYDADAIREPHDDKNGLDRFKNGGVSRDEYVPETQAWNGGGMKHHHRDYNPAGRNKRSVWTVATQPYPNAHFATYPPKLIEPCVLAGAPERACGECGAPWVRVVERTRARDGASPTIDGRSADEHGHSSIASLPTSARSDASRSGMGTPTVETLGFEPSCSHGDGSATGVCLDPFAGAGTTGLVAFQHGRSFIGIELSAEYARMARERIDAWVRCGFRAPARGPDADPAQVTFDLFGDAA